MVSSSKWVEIHKKFRKIKNKKSSCKKEYFCDIYFSKRCHSGCKDGKERIDIIHTILFQKYRVLSLLGSGSSSNVYLAEHIKLGHYRAIKCIPKTQTRAPLGNTEASLLKNLKHPGIPVIYDVEEDDAFDYIIEEYVQGESLSAFVQNQDEISQDKIISFGIQLCEIMEYLHSQSPNPLLYLDLKPEHVIICGKQLKLIDFGIATAVKEADSICRNYGTRGFAAPEQYKNGACKPQTDVFGIGAILYYMLTGEEITPFFSKKSCFPKNCSVPFRKIILKAIAEKIELRYRSVEQLKKALQKISLAPRGTSPDAHLLEKIIIVGSQKRIGVTHIAIGLVMWLNQKKNPALLKARTDSKFTEALMDFKEGVLLEDGIYEYQDFQFLMEETAGLEARKSYIRVEDFGDEVAQVAEEEEADLTILVVGGRPWEVKKAIHAYEALAEEENLIVLCNYANKTIARKYASIFRKKIYRFLPDAEPFSMTKEKAGLFAEIFEERRKR